MIQNYSWVLEGNGPVSLAMKEEAAPAVPHPACQQVVQYNKDRVLAENA